MIKLDRKCVVCGNLLTINDSVCLDGSGKCVKCIAKKHRELFEDGVRQGKYSVGDCVLFSRGLEIHTLLRIILTFWNDDKEITSDPDTVKKKTEEIEESIRENERELKKWEQEIRKLRRGVDEE